MQELFFTDEGSGRYFSDDCANCGSANLDGGVTDDAVDPRDNCANVPSSSVRNSCFLEISDSKSELN